MEASMMQKYMSQLWHDDSLFIVDVCISGYCKGFRLQAMRGVLQEQLAGDGGYPRLSAK